MTLKVAILGECLITFLAEIRFHPRMDPNVFLQAASLGECLITFLAAIRFLLSMDPNVTFQAARLGECFITFLSEIWICLRISTYQIKLPLNIHNWLDHSINFQIKLLGHFQKSYDWIQKYMTHLQV